MKKQQKGGDTAEQAPSQPSNPGVPAGFLWHTQPPTSSQKASWAQPVTSSVDTDTSTASAGMLGKDQALQTVCLGSNPRSTTHELALGMMFNCSMPQSPQLKTGSKSSTHLLGLPGKRQESATAHGDC